MKQLLMLAFTGCNFALNYFFTVESEQVEICKVAQKRTRSQG